MTLITRSVTNVSSGTLNLFIPGYDTTKPAVTIAPSATLDLFSVLDAEQMSAIQPELAKMVLDGSLTVAATASSSSVDLSGTSVKVGSLSFTNNHADIGTVGAATPASTICVAPVSGMYLLSFYGIATTPPSGADAAPNLYMKWTDEHGLQASFAFAGTLDMTYTDGANQLTIPIYAVAGSPIWMATSAGNYSGTIRWSFYFTVTAL